MESSFTFARFRGIPIGAHWSWVFVFGLVVWSLGATLFPQTYPGLSDGTYLLMGLVTGILFFGSILLHELGHAVQAVKEGMEIDGITLWLFGGVARFKGMFPSAGSEFRIAIAGPLVSVGVAVFFGGLTFVGTRVDWGLEIQGIVDYLWRINVLVVAFNLIPALPLDGGRVLRSWLWHRQENFTAATISAARAGKAFGALLLTVGLLNLFTTDSGTGGLWFLFLGWFLIQAAQSEASAMQVRALLGERTVREVMTGAPVTTTSQQTVTEFLGGAHGQMGHTIYPVVDDGRLVGIASLRRAGEVAHAERDLVPVGRVMDPVGSVTVLDPDARVIDVVDDLQEEPRRAPVVEDGRLVGIVALSDLVRLVETEKARGNGGPPKTKTGGILVWVIVGVIMLLAAGYLYHPPVAVISPGTAIDVTGGIKISGVPTDEVDGEYVLTAVGIDSDPSALDVAWEWAVGEGEVVSLSTVVPEGVDQDTFFREQREVFRQSEQLAAAAAAQAVGMKVSISGTGARVVDVLEDTPAERELRPGDVIVAIDGEPVDMVTDLQRLVRGQPAGTTFEVTFERAGDEETVELESVPLPGDDDAAGIGVIVSTRDFNIDLPFQIDFDELAIGGPSAGFVYSLAISDMLDDGDYAEGRSIAATGTMDIDGRVGEIGHPDLKAIAAEGEGADLFLVPKSQVEEVGDPGIEVIGVDRLDSALELLEGTS